MEGPLGQVVGTGEAPSYPQYLEDAMLWAVGLEQTSRCLGDRKHLEGWAVSSPWPTIFLG